MRFRQLAVQLLLYPDYEHPFRNLDGVEELAAELRAWKMGQAHAVFVDPVLPGRVFQPKEEPLAQEDGLPLAAKLQSIVGLDPLDLGQPGTQRRERVEHRPALAARGDGRAAALCLRDRLRYRPTRSSAISTANISG